MIKSIEPYSSKKCTLREEVCSRLIKPTTQVYLDNVGLLTLGRTCKVKVRRGVPAAPPPMVKLGCVSKISPRENRGNEREETKTFI
jgi:hypothetical protein